MEVFSDWNGKRIDRSEVIFLGKWIKVMFWED